MNNATSLVAHTSQNARSSESPSTEQMSSRLHSQTNLLHTSTTRDHGTSTANSSCSTAIGPSNETSSGPHQFANHSDETTSNILPVKAGPADVICGRGLHIMNRHGNLNFHLLVNRYRQTYLTSTRRDKAAITRHIVQEIKSTGARFLRRFDEDSRRADDDRWVEVDDKAAYKKVSHALRLRKSEHGRNFLKSVKIQEKMNSNVTMTAQQVVPIPLEVAAASSLQQNHSGNGSSLLCLSSLDMMGRPSCPQPEIQYQPAAVPHTPPQLDYALAQQQMGLPTSCPLPGIQYQPAAVPPTPPQLASALAQQQMGLPISCPVPGIQYQPAAVPPTPPQVAYALAQQQMGLPISCPVPGIQYQPAAIHAPPSQLDYTRSSQPQITQPLMQVLPWQNVNGYGNNVMLDPRLVANAFALTLATMTQAANQQRSNVDETMGSSSQLFSLGRDAERRPR